MNNNTEKTELEQLFDPKELATAFEHTMNFVKGDTEALPDVLSHSGRLLLRLSRRLSTTQMILVVGALTVGAIFVAKRMEDTLEDMFDDEDENKGGRKALGSGSAGGQGNRSNATSGNQGDSAAASGKSEGAGTGSKQTAGSDGDKKASDSKAGK